MSRLIPVTPDLPHGRRFLSKCSPKEASSPRETGAFLPSSPFWLKCCLTADFWEGVGGRRHRWESGEGTVRASGDLLPAQICLVWDLRKIRLEILVRARKADAGPVPLHLRPQALPIGAVQPPSPAPLCKDLKADLEDNPNHPYSSSNNNNRFGGSAVHPGTPSTLEAGQ